MHQPFTLSPTLGPLLYYIIGGVLALVACVGALQDEGILNSLSDYHQAKCLDGSPGIYYFRPGTSVWAWYFKRWISCTWSVFLFRLWDGGKQIFLFQDGWRVLLFCVGLLRQVSWIIPLFHLLEFIQGRYRAMDCELGLGSSKCWWPKLNLTAEHPYLSSSESRNPLLFNWNIVYMVNWKLILN
jgi:hypothetical protein